jgi:hypothetical protein
MIFILRETRTAVHEWACCWSLVGSIYGRSSLKSAHFAMIHYQTWLPQAILVCDWPMFWNLLTYNWKNPTCMHVKNPLRTLYKNYFLFIIHFKVRIIELFWLVNFVNIIQSEHSLHILSEMIWFIDRPILLALNFLIVQSEELLLLKPIIFTKKTAWCTTFKVQVCWNYRV